MDGSGTVNGLTEKNEGSNVGYGAALFPEWQRVNIGKDRLVIGTVRLSGKTIPKYPRLLFSVPWTWTQSHGAA